MIPTISLGPWDGPDFEILWWNLYPILASIIEHHGPVPEKDLESAFNLLALDFLHLHEGSRSFFLKAEDVCRRIQSGEIDRYSSTTLIDAGFEFYIRPYPQSGVITPEMKAAAEGFLAFLAANPGHWPPRAADLAFSPPGEKVSGGA